MDDVGEELFRIIDQDGDGVISAEELRDVVIKYNAACCREEEGQEEWERPEDGLSSLASSYRAARCLFDSMDADSSGLLDASDISSCLGAHGLASDSATVSRMLEAADVDRDGSVSFKEFFLIFSLSRTHRLRQLLSFWSATSFSLAEGNSLYLARDQSRSMGFPAWHIFLAGGLGGAVSKTLTAPLSRVSLILQVSSASSSASAWSVFRDSMRSGGLRSLFRGNLATVLKIAPSAAINLGSYARIKKLVKRRTGGHFDIGHQLLSGAFAGAVSLTSTYPLDIIKTHLSVNNSATSQSLVSTARAIVSSDGVAGLFKGLPLALIEVVPNVALHFMMYERLRRFLVGKQTDEGVTVLPIMGASSISAFVASSATYPLVLLRRNQQMAHGNPPWMGVLKDQWNSGGLRGMYRGIMPYYAQIVPSIALSFTIFETTKQYLNTHF